MTETWKITPKFDKRGDVVYVDYVDESGLFLGSEQCERRLVNKGSGKKPKYVAQWFDRSGELVTEEDVEFIER